MGEFSAGKSTLSNLLIGAPSLPVKVTATQLPPVWISHGDSAAYRVDIAGTESPVDLNDLSDVSPADTQFIRVFHKTDALELCDLIDMPGISDPNMPPEVWERVVHHADAVIWCTHATQAWRQSEAAVWSTFSPELFEKSLLLLTRFDKITNDRDRQRVVARVASETNGLFRGVFPISLTRAMDAGEDLEIWQDSGAEAFASALIDLARELSGPGDPPATAAERIATDATPQSVTVLSKARPPAQKLPRVGHVMPKRVVSDSAIPCRAERPPRESAQLPDQDPHLSGHGKAFSPRPPSA